MTTCSYCLDHMAARSEKQRKDRIKNIADNPNVLTSGCPKCGGFEWAITDARVERTRPTWLSQFMLRWFGV